MSFSWIVDGQIAAMSRPWPDEAADLAALGVAGMLSLTEALPDGFPAHGILHFHVPIRDFSAPTVADFAEALSFMDEVLATGGAVAVHCGAGLGRTGTVIAAWLVAHGWEPGSAIREVRRRRPGSIETEEQEAAIFHFAAKLHDTGGGIA